VPPTWFDEDGDLHTCNPEEHVGEWLELEVLATCSACGAEWDALSLEVVFSPCPRCGACPGPLDGSGAPDEKAVGVSKERHERAGVDARAVARAAGLDTAGPMWLDVLDELIARELPPDGTKE
jgi:hypothetical protein